MATAITGTSANADLQAFFDVATLEQQLVYLADLLVQAQTTYNTTEPIPDPLVNRIAAQPGATGLVVQAAFNMGDGAATVAPHAAVTALPIGADPLEADGSDTLTGDAATFAGLSTLESQMAFVAAKIEAAEAAYNTANPNTPENRTTVVPDYNNKRLSISATLPLATGGLAALAGDYLP